MGYNYLLPDTDSVTAAEATVISSEEGFRSLEGDWNGLHERARGTVFQSFTWCWNWWRIYGNDGAGLHIVTSRIDGRLSAVLPLYLERIGGLGVSLGRLRMIGVYETYGEYSILAEAESAEASTAAIARELASQLGKPGYDILSLFRFPPESPPMEGLMRGLRASGLRGRFVPQVIRRVMMNLPGSWEEYLAALSSNERESLRRKTKKLLRTGAEIEVVETPDDGAFSDYVRLHSESWRPRGVRGYFASENFTMFLRTVTLGMMPRGNAKLYFLKKDGKRFAAVHAFFMHDQCCFYLSGLDRNHPLLNMSPGKVLLAHVIHDAIDRGYGVFDFQGGDEEYKFQLGGRMTSFAKALFWPNDRRSFKIMVFLGLQSLKQGLRWRIKERLIPTVKWLVTGARHGRPGAAGQRE